MFNTNMTLSDFIHSIIKSSIEHCYEGLLVCHPGAVRLDINIELIGHSEF